MSSITMSGIAALILVGLAMVFGAPDRVGGSTGGLDREFGTGSKVHPADFDSRGIAVIATGKHDRIVLGDESLRISSYMADGAVDETFGGGSGSVDALVPRIEVPHLRAAIIQPDGKTLLGGYGSSRNGADHIFSFLMRLNRGGEIDRSFGTGGTIRSSGLSAGFRGKSIHDLALDSRGRIVAAGREGRGVATITRFRRDGSVDPSFGTKGSTRLKAGVGVPMTAMSSILIRKDGKIVAGGTLGGQPAVVRLHPNGRLDRSFGDHGRAVGPRIVSGDCLNPTKLCVAGDIAASPAGGIVYSGFNPRKGSSFVLRLTKNGKPDRRFSRDGVLWLDESAITSGLGSYGKMRRGTGAESYGSVVRDDGSIFSLVGVALRSRGYTTVGLNVSARGMVAKVRGQKVAFSSPEPDYPPTPPMGELLNGDILIGAWDSRQRPTLFRLAAP
ncbi:MAG TPA: hypothetical protein VMF31_13160 [Solirubrobacterales bacterium]|nr:hypothetical protein [Solirubrobacterales bacterium]